MIFRLLLLCSLAFGQAAAAAPANVAQVAEVSGEFFQHAEMTLGRDADRQEHRDGVQRISGGSSAPANIAGSWDMQGALAEGVFYLVTGNVRVVNADDTPSRARVLMRFGSGVELTTLNGQSAVSLFDRMVVGEAEFAGHVRFDRGRPLFSALGLGDRKSVV